MGSAHLRNRATVIPARNPNITKLEKARSSNCSSSQGQALPIRKANYTMPVSSRPPATITGLKQGQFWVSEMYQGGGY